MKILLCVNRRCDPDFSVTEKIKKQLADHGCEVTVVIPFDMKDPAERDAAVRGKDLVITLGGDGTVLKMAPHAAGENVPLMGINRGRLGYLTELSIDQTDQLDLIFSGLKSEKRMMLRADVIRGEKTVSTCTALNDILIRPDAVNKTTHIKTEVDIWELMDYIGDGIIAATPTGSTGYSFSAGGMIVDPSHSCILITPLLAHSAYARGHVLADSRTVRFSVLKPDNVLIADGTVFSHLEENDIVQVTRSEKDLCLAKLHDTGLNDRYLIRNI